MCRVTAYLGTPATLAALVIDPPFGLARQAWAPRRQRSGTMNTDGFGVGWYADGDPVPARYRQTGPIWADPSFADVARVTRTRAMLAAVRDATAGTDTGLAAVSPYSFSRWLFTHNGVLNGWPAATIPLAGTLSAGDLLALDARCDSALAWALVLARLRAGASPASALSGVVAALEEHGVGGRFNFFLTDGDVIAATAMGETLCYRRLGAAVVVASEPSDDEAGWTDVPDRNVLTASVGNVRVEPLRRRRPKTGGHSATRNGSHLKPVPSAGDAELTSPMPPVMLRPPAGGHHPAGLEPPSAPRDPHPPYEGTTSS